MGVLKKKVHNQLSVESNRQKKFGLIWEDKKEHIVEECKKKLPILKENKSKAIVKDKDKPTNLILEGDNYHALSVLSYTHKERIDAIYIDPPYNTGAKEWKYNNDYVDKEDSYRHSKWLSFMEKRLKLAKDLLKDTGIIAISIDENEYSHLKLLLDEIFNESNFLGTACVRSNPSGRTKKSEISTQHEYILFYSRNKNKSGISTFYVSPENKSHNYKKDENGNYYEKRNLIRGRKKTERPKRFFPIYVCPNKLTLSIKKKKGFVSIFPINEKGHELTWDREKDIIENLFNKQEIWAENHKGVYKIFFKFRPDLQRGETPKSLWCDPKYSAREHGVNILKKIFGTSPFEYPKSIYTVIDCIKSMNNSKDSVILDFFAGSGTTGHAVLEMNKEDGGNRQFILCTNNENNICTEVTFPRIKRVINGYRFKGKQKKILLEERVNLNFLKNSKSLLEKIENIKKKYKLKYSSFKTDFKDQIFKLIGEKEIKDKKEGLGGNLRYFKTDFINYENKAIDSLEMKLMKNITEILCIKENAFEKVKEVKSFYKIFKNNKHYLGIIFRDESFKDFVKEIKKINQSTAVYVFSLFGTGAFKKTFNNHKNIKVIPVPKAILRVYKKIFYKR